MSEEKECGCKSGIRGNGCFDYHPRIEQVEGLKEQIKSLESRLAEMEGFKNTFRDDAEGWMKACDSLKHDLKLSLEKNESLESRLKFFEDTIENQGIILKSEKATSKYLSEKLYQAEARKCGHQWDSQGLWCERCGTQNPKEEIDGLRGERDSLRHRLSHLMDVGGKMAGALELVLKRGTQVQNSDQFMFEVIKGTELALSMWEKVSKENV
jgi:uncharacterized coiled-coil DUF342 family protein